MGGKSKSSSSQTQTLSPWSQQQYAALSGKIQGLLGQPFKPYDGQMTAGLSDLEQSAMSGAQGAMGAGDQYFDMASGAAQGVAGYSPQQIQARQFAGTDLSAYQNPYEDQVVSATLSDIDRQRQLALNNQAGGFTKAGAWGGSRHGIADAETNRAAIDLAARTAGQLRSQGFNTAASLANQDLDRAFGTDVTNANLGMQGAGLRLNAAGILGNLGESIGSAKWRDLMSSAALGEMGRNVEQSDLDRRYNEFMRAQDDPYKRAAAYMGLLGATPMLVNSKGTGTQKQSPGLGSILGTGLQLFKISDARLKKSVMPHGTDDKGRQWYAFRYVWEDDDAPLHVGVMAQEVAETDPDAVILHPTGYLMVDYEAL